jgi:hypothetical protein
MQTTHHHHRDRKVLRLLDYRRHRRMAALSDTRVSHHRTTGQTDKMVSLRHRTEPTGTKESIGKTAIRHRHRASLRD